MTTTQPSEILQAQAEKKMRSLLTECHAYLKPVHDQFMRAEKHEEEIHRVGSDLFKRISCALGGKVEPECSCPSGDGSLRYPCPAHGRPALDEREAFERAVPIPEGVYWSMPNGCYLSLNGREQESSDAYAATLRLEGWKSRAVRPAQTAPHDAPYAPGIAGQLERTDWTPEEALRWYAEGKHFDTVNGRTRIIDSGAIASSALKHLSLPYLEMKGDAELSELRAQTKQQPTLWARQCDLDEPDPAIFVAREQVEESGYVVPFYAAPIAQTEQQPLFYINPFVIDELEGKRKPSPGGLTWSRTACGHWTFAVYAAPIAQTDPHPEQSGLVEMIDAAMIEMRNIAPPLRRSDCGRLIRAAMAAKEA